MRESRGNGGGGATAGGVAAALLVLLVAAVCVRLGFWQLDRLEQRRSRNAALAGALALPPLDLRGAALDSLRRDPERFLFRRVRATGAYLPAGEVVLRGRGMQGSPGVNLLTPLRLAGSDLAVVVNRGWAPSPDALTVDPGALAEPGVRSVEGLVQPFPAAVGEANPLETSAGGVAILSVQRPDSALLRRRASAPLLPVYLQQLPDSASAAGAPLRRLPLPEMDEGPHLSYAVQWFSFAAIALGGLGLMLARSRRGPP